jgi:hypothetical protein
MLQNKSNNAFYIFSFDLYHNFHITCLFSCRPLEKKCKFVIGCLETTNHGIPLGQPIKKRYQMLNENITSPTFHLQFLRKNIEESVGGQLGTQSEITMFTKISIW